jgi:outer membrane autotransporter protein
MVLRARLAGVLAGVSLAALSLATGRASAETVTVTIPGSYVQSLDTDFLVVDTSSIGGDFINDAVIGPDPAMNGVSLKITGTTIGGALINNVTASTYVFTSTTVAIIEDVAGIGVDSNSVIGNGIENNGLISATAHARGLFASAEAHGIEYDAVGIDAESNVLNAADGTINALAIAEASWYSASAFAEAVGVDQWVNGDVSATANVDNSGTIRAEADALGVEGASAKAHGVEARAFSDGDSVTNVINLSGALIEAIAKATATGWFSYEGAYAEAFGVDQRAVGDDTALSYVDNSGTIKATANAIGVEGAEAEAHGVEADALSDGAAKATTLNGSGDTIAAVALASATGTYTFGYAKAEAVGVDQWVVGTGGESSTADALVQNSGQITATATAIAGTRDVFAEGERAFAEAKRVEQDARSPDAATATVNNTGANSLISGSAIAKAQGSYSNSLASAQAFGVDQDVLSDYSASALVTNDGTISATAVAYASSFQDTYARAQSGGVRQAAGPRDAAIQDATATVENGLGGTISALATASAFALGSYGNTLIDARAFATGVEQAASAVMAQTLVTNDGTITATANAYATGRTYGEVPNAYAVAGARGVDQFAAGRDGGAIASLTNNSSGSITASANAFASGGEGYFNSYGDPCADAMGGVQACANATGADQFATVTGSATGKAEATVTNSGSVNAIAFAGASGTYVDANADAETWGVLQSAKSSRGEASAEVENSGTIYAYTNARARSSASARVNAEAHGVDQKVWGYTDALASVENTSSIFATVVGVATGTYEGQPSRFSYMELEARGVRQDVMSHLGTAAASLTNGQGDIISALADGKSRSYGQAVALVAATAVSQTVQGAASSTYDDPGNGIATALVENQGTIRVVSKSLAESTYGLANAYANSLGVFQHALATYDSADGGEIATATLTNSSSGTIEALATATAFAYLATGDGYATPAVANADATGVEQRVRARGYGDALASLTNDGVIRATGRANAVATYGDASAYGGGQYAIYSGGVIGVIQSATNTYGGGDAASVVLTNTSSGLIEATAFGLAQARSSAYAQAFATGVEQNSASKDGTSGATVTNGGTIRAVAQSNAVGTSEDSPASRARSKAAAIGVTQDVFGDAADGKASFTNQSLGRVTANAHAVAKGDNLGQSSATAAGLLQSVNAIGGVASAEISNAGLLAASATADAFGFTAIAAASAIGGSVTLSGASLSLSFSNSGTIQATAKANANSFVDNSMATAFGQKLIGSGLLDLEDSTVSGRINALADAFTEIGVADAQAIGFLVSGQGLTGNMRITGRINASALANAAGVGALALASAIGLVEDAGTGANAALFTNSGTVRAYAEAKGANAEARSTGVVITGTGPITYNNAGGGIWAGAVINGELQRGTAITTTGLYTFRGGDDDLAFLAAGGPATLNLSGNDADGTGYKLGNDYLSNLVKSSLATQSGRYGYIFGNIELGKLDTINVVDGYTIFDGVMTAGALNVRDDGVLALLINADVGPSAVDVGSFDLASDGTLVFELGPSTASGDYPQISAATATVNGKAIAMYQAGLYADSFRYEAVVSSGSAMTVADPDTGFVEVQDNSVLLDTRGEMVGDNQIDLVVNRVAFDQAVSGLTQNQNAVAETIEDVYGDIDPNSDFAGLVGSLFSLNADDYPEFLNQLTGAEYAQHLQSVLWSTRTINRLVTERMECSGATPGYMESSGLSADLGDGTSATATADAPSMADTNACFEPKRFAVWARGFGSWNSLDGDSEAPGFDEDQYGVIFGADYSFTEDWFAGLAGGYFNSNGDFDNWGKAPGASIDYDGLQLALYGGYDNSVYYARGVVSYGNYDGDSHRYIQGVGVTSSSGGGVGGVGGAGGSAIDPAGDPSSDVISFYGETGYRFALAEETHIAPFLGLSLAHADLDGFTEKDPLHTGAALTVHGSDADSIASVLGLRLDSEYVMGSGTLYPEVSVAWTHEFGDTHQTVNMSFADGPPGANFRVVGSDVARDAVVIDAGARMVINDSFELGLFYDGWFSGDYTSNAVTARFGYRF